MASFAVCYLKKKKRKNLEKIAAWPISVYMSGDVSERVCDCCWV